MNRIMYLFKKFTICSVMILFVLPANGTHKLKSFEFGGGGGVSTDGTTSIEGIVGEVGGEQTDGTTKVNSGLVFMQQANTPVAPTFTNPDSSSNNLHIIINQSDNASDTLYSIAISSDSFVTTNYVQNDNTVGATLGAEDFQNYAGWGSGTGEYIIGLTGDTTYEVKVKARQGDFTESPWGPTASAATINVTLSFDIDIDDISNPTAETAAPYSVNVGNLTAGSVTGATDLVWVDIETNAPGGAYVYVYGANAGLRSATTSYTIAAVSNTLNSVSEGYGIQTESTSESSGGPLEPVSPYDGASTTVGIVDTTIRELFSSSGSPITDGRGAFEIQAKISNSTPAANDYTDTLTLIASGTF